MDNRGHRASKLQHRLILSLCLFPAAVTLRPLPMANRCQRLLRYPPLCSSLRLVCRRARHPLPAGRLKGCVQRQWPAGPVLTVADPVFLHAGDVLAEEASQRGPLPLTSRRSLAGWGGGGCPAISLSLTLFRSRARPLAAEGTRARMLTFSVPHPCPPLHVAKRVSGKRARLESRPHQCTG